MIPSHSAVCSPTYECGPALRAPRLFLLLFAYTVLAKFFLSLYAMLRISLFCDISAWIQYGIDISSSCALIVLGDFPLLYLPCAKLNVSFSWFFIKTSSCVLLLCTVASLTFSLAHRSFFVYWHLLLLKPFPCPRHHRHSRWCKKVLLMGRKRRPPMIEWKQVRQPQTQQDQRRSSKWTATV